MSRWLAADTGTHFRIFYPHAPLQELGKWVSLGALCSLVWANSIKPCDVWRAYSMAVKSATLVAKLTLHCLCVLSCIPLFVTLWTVARQASLSMEFPRQEYWRGLPFPSPGDRPTQGLNMGLWFLLHWQAGSLHCATWEAWLSLNLHLISYFLMFLVCRVPLENLQGRKTVVKEGASIPGLPN